MMSKNSFLANLRENNKRRVWVWILSGLFWFLYYPVGLMMLISREKNYNLIYNRTESAAKEALLRGTKNWFSINGGFYLFIISLIAVICAIQGFSYLYNKKKVDFYHSIPVKKSRRFAVIYLNGVLIFLIPYVVNMLLAMLVAGINGAMNGSIAATAMVSLLLSVVLFLGTYGLTLIAVMLTGNLVITAFATIIFLVYELVVRGMLWEYCRNFYDYFAFNSVKTEPVLSPAAQILQIVEKSSGETLWTAALPHILAGVAMAAAFTGIAWFCYKRRPAEAAGKAMAFPKTKGVVKVLLVIPFALGIGLFVMDAVGETPYAMMVFGMVLAVIIGSCVIEVIYEMDIKGVFHKKYQMLISGVCVAVIFLIFCFDLTGFDAWAPSPKKLEDAVVIFSNDMYGNNYVDAEFNSLDYESYFLSKPGISDIDAICQLSEKKAPEGHIWCTMAYRMKGGKVVWRNFPVSGEEEELLNRIIGSKEYREAKCQLYDDAVYAGIKEQKINEFTFSTGFKEENLAPEDLDEFREVYLKDLENTDYSMLRDEFVCGRIDVDVEKKVETGKINKWFRYDVYPSYTGTVAFLKEKGVYDGSYLDIDKIAGITVTNNHNEMYEVNLSEGSTEAAPTMNRSSGAYAVTKIFYEEEQIKELAQAFYPYAFDTYWKRPDTIDYNYEVTVQYKSGEKNSNYYRGYNEAHLIADRIPAWLEKETAYQ